MSALLEIARQTRDGALWRSSNAQVFLNRLINRQRNKTAGYTDRDHLLAAVEWLERAQDVTADGGVSGRYSLKQGWSSSYPETTGYIVPTFLALARELDDARFQERARRCVEFLLPLQAPDGAFPGMEVASNRSEPSVFNTAQILHGLLAWHTATEDERALAAARRAGEWLLSVQDDDGAWRRHFYLNIATTYSAHAACWLAQLGQYTGDERLLKASARHLDWVLGHVDTTSGWIDLCGFGEDQHEGRHALTHTIAYALWGILTTSEILERTDGLDVARRAAHAIGRRLELSGWIPGVLNHRWQGVADYACLTGNAQLALLWLRLHEREKEPRCLNAALKAIDLVEAAQVMDCADTGLRGGVPGSDPIWGKYLYATIPNWAAKFFIDALLAKKAAVAGLAQRPRGGWQIPRDVPTRLPQQLSVVTARRPKVVMYTSPDSIKVAQMVTEWAKWDFRPDCVLIERRPSEGIYARVTKRIRDDGFRWILSLPLVRRGGARREGGSSGPYLDPIAFCRQRDIRFVELGPLDSPESLALVRRLEPDLAIHAGAGIMRPSLLSIPKIGTLNAHMGILPRYRGMNVTEWAAFVGDPVGCSIHWIDPGIDTGDIVCVRVIEPSEARGIAQLRSAVDTAQVQLLGEVVKLIIQSGQAPPRRKQAAGEGMQFFRMHSDLVAVLEAELASNPIVAVARCSSANRG